jgi:hypothetical protein
LLYIRFPHAQSFQCLTLPHLHSSPSHSDCKTTEQFHQNRVIPWEIYANIFSGAICLIVITIGCILLSSNNERILIICI